MEQRGIYWILARCERLEALASPTIIESVSDTVAEPLCDNRDLGGMCGVRGTLSLKLARMRPETTPETVNHAA